MSPVNILTVPQAMRKSRRDSGSAILLLFLDASPHVVLPKLLPWSELARSLCTVRLVPCRASLPAQGDVCFARPALTAAQALCQSQEHSVKSSNMFCQHLLGRDVLVHLHTTRWPASTTNMHDQHLGGRLTCAKVASLRSHARGINAAAFCTRLCKPSGSRF